MNRYYVHYPRNFANEYTVYVVGSEADEDRLYAAFDGDHERLEKITRKRAIYLGSVRPNMALRWGEQWYGGWKRDYHADPPTYADHIAATLHATLGALNSIERQRERERQEHEYRRSLRD